MKTNLFILTTACFFLFACNGKQSESEQKSDAELGDFPDTTLKEVSYQNVKITDNFWRPKIETNRTIGIRHALKQVSKSLESFDIAAGTTKGDDTGGMATDSDVYKIIQGAAYALYHTQDKELEATIDSVIDRVVAAQQQDGYLFAYWIINDLSMRWTDLERKHELYCAGHMFEAAAAYYQVTGKRKFLESAMRFADHVDSVFGPDKRLDVPGHEEVELGLLKLYEATGEKKYLDLAVFFVDERGDPKRMVVEKITPPDKDPNANTPRRWRPPSYMQDHLPVTKQYYAVGHAVRAGYLYAAMTDIATKTKSPKYLPALDSIWNDVVRKKMYVTGGVGTRQFHDEGFGQAYLLPNDQAYSETCSSIAMYFWNRRMNLLHADSKYGDMVELSMYNSVIAGISLSGDKTFYTNPIESKGNYRRRLWHSPPCCPTNMTRFLPEIGTVIYGKTDDAIYINQFIGSETKIDLEENKVALVLITDYPWKGIVNIEVNPEKTGDFEMNIRIPGWARGEFLPGGLYHFIDHGTPDGNEVILKVNGKMIPQLDIRKGYAVINREWKSGDKVELVLPMNIKIVGGDERIEDTRGKVALMRGPMVYCIEEIDNQDYFDDNKKAYLLTSDMEAKRQDGLLSGVVIINGKASFSGKGEPINITAIPYYSWNNRGQGQMKVWLQTEL